MKRNTVALLCVAAVLGLALDAAKAEPYRSAITEGPIRIGDGDQAEAPNWTDTFWLDSVDGNGVLSVEGAGFSHEGCVVEINGVPVGELQPSPEHHRSELNVDESLLQVGENTFYITAPPDGVGGLDDMNFRNAALMDRPNVYGPRYPVIIEKGEVHLGDNPPPHEWSDTFQLDSVQTPVALSIETIGVGSPGCMIEINGQEVGEVNWELGSGYHRHLFSLDPEELDLEEGENTFWITAPPDGMGGWDDMNFRNAMVVPEPATLSLLALGGLAAMVRRRKR